MQTKAGKGARRPTPCGPMKCARPVMARVTATVAAMRKGMSYHCATIQEVHGDRLVLRHRQSPWIATRAARPVPMVKGMWESTPTEAR